MIAWESNSTAGALRMTVRGSLEFDGNAEFSVALTADSAVTLRDVRLEIPLRPEVARYLMGLGFKGGARPASLDWTWDVKHNQDGAWIGDVNAGLQFTLKDDKYVRPLNTNFYLLQAARDAGLVGQRRARADAGSARGGEAYIVVCYSGARTHGRRRGRSTTTSGSSLTPFHPLDTKAQWATRYFHAYVPLDAIAKMGANMVNVHHATAINPYINYPFLRPAAMKAYIDSAHAKRHAGEDLLHRARAHEPRAGDLRAAQPRRRGLRARPGRRVLVAAGAPRHQLHRRLVRARPSRTRRSSTPAISRWHNFYVEGLDWLVEQRRHRRPLHRRRRVRPDDHEAGPEGADPGPARRRSSTCTPPTSTTRATASPSSANLYLEHFPFIDRLWFGEYFDYNALAGLLADRDVGHSVRPDGRDAARAAATRGAAWCSA